MTVMMKDKFHIPVDENILLAKKLVAQSIYDAAKLEGINTTFPETEAILEGINVPNARLDDITTILNLRDAWRVLLSNIKNIKVDLKFIEKLNENVSRNESLEWGKLRSGQVGIAGTGHRPPVPNRSKTARDIDKIVGDTASSTSEKAINLLLYVMYHQLFWDGNKRTAALAANAILIRGGAGVLSVADSDLVEFNRLLSGYYNSGEAGDLARFVYDKAITDSGREIVDQNVGINVGINVGLKIPLNESEIGVLEAMSHNPFATAEEIARRIGKTDKTVERATDELKKRGIIERIGSKKTGYWQISPVEK